MPEPRDSCLLLRNPALLPMRSELMLTFRLTSWLRSRELREALGEMDPSLREW